MCACVCVCVTKSGRVMLADLNIRAELWAYFVTDCCVVCTTFCFLCSLCMIQNCFVATLHVFLFCKRLGLF
jgi:hypothetical protein